MNRFENEILKGNFVVGKCPKCTKVIWPPSDFCNKCFSALMWKKSDRRGTLIEYSRKDDSYFCIAEFEGKIRIIGTLKIQDKVPQVGKPVELKYCGIKDGHYNFTLSMI